MLALAAALLLPGAAHADVLVHYDDSSISLGECIPTGVWYQSYSGGPRNARITITRGRRTYFRRNVRATTRWRYWHYCPRRAARYRVTYKVPGGRVSYIVVVRDDELVG